MSSIKTHDTTGDQLLRVILRIINGLWVLVLAIGFLPAGIAWLVLTIVFTVWNGNRRERKYLENAQRLAQINSEAQRRAWGGQ